MPLLPGPGWSCVVLQHSPVAGGAPSLLPPEFRGTSLSRAGGQGGLGLSYLSEIWGSVSDPLYPARSLEAPRWGRDSQTPDLLRRPPSFLPPQRLPFHLLPILDPWAQPHLPGTAFPQPRPHPSQEPTSFVPPQLTSHLEPLQGRSSPTGGGFKWPEAR